MNGMRTVETGTLTTETERRRVHAVVEALARTRQLGYSAAEVAHDARNMVTALDLYCDLLAEPGVLAPESVHFAGELKLVATASRRLIEKLMLLDSREDSSAGEGFAPAAAVRAAHVVTGPMEKMEGRLPSDPIDDFRREVEANLNLLDALAGMAMAVTMKAEGGARPVRLTAEDLTRVLVNLVKNAAEAMRRAGRIEIALRERPAVEDGAAELELTVEDSGPGIPEGLLERIFEPGFSNHAAETGGEGGWPASHRGLGLSITRSIVHAAGGRTYAENRNQGGARIVIELPIRPQ